MSVQFLALVFIVITGASAVGLDMASADLLATSVAFTLVLVVGVRGTGRHWRDVLPLDGVPRHVVFLAGLLGVVLAVLLSQLILGLKTVVPAPSLLSDASERLVSENIAARLLAVLLVAPVAEELFYRGLVLRGLCMKYSVKTAVVLSSLIFTAVHLNPWQAIVAFPMGIVLAWLRLQSGSLIPCMVGHFACNAQSLVTGFLLNDVAGLDFDRATHDWMPAWYLAAAAVLSIAAFWTLSRTLQGVATASPTAVTLGPAGRTCVARSSGAIDP